MEQRIRQLLKRLAFLGYCSFEIKCILKDAVGTDCFENISYNQRTEIIKHLEKYEQLGSDFAEAYSK